MVYRPAFGTESGTRQLNVRQQTVVVVAYKEFRYNGRPLGYDEVLEMIRIMIPLKRTPSSPKMFEVIDNDIDGYATKRMTSAKKNWDDWISEVAGVFQQVLDTLPEARNRIRNLSGYTKRLKFPAPEDYLLRWNGVTIRNDQLCLLHLLANRLTDGEGTILKEEYARDLATQKVFDGVPDPANRVIAIMRVSTRLITKFTAELIKGDEDFFLNKVEQHQIDYAKDLESGAYQLPLPINSQSNLDPATTSSLAGLSVEATASSPSQPLVPFPQDFEFTFDEYEDYNESIDLWALPSEEMGSQVEGKGKGRARESSSGPPEDFDINEYLNVESDEPQAPETPNKGKGKGKQKRQESPSESPHKGQESKKTTVPDKKRPRRGGKS